MLRDSSNKLLGWDINEEEVLFILVLDAILESYKLKKIFILLSLDIKVESN